MNNSDWTYELSSHRDHLYFLQAQKTQLEMHLVKAAAQYLMSWDDLPVALPPFHVYLDTNMETDQGLFFFSKESEQSLDTLNKQIVLRWSEPLLQYVDFLSQSNARDLIMEVLYDLNEGQWRKGIVQNILAIYLPNYLKEKDLQSFLSQTQAQSLQKETSLHKAHPKSMRL